MKHRRALSLIAPVMLLVSLAVIPVMAQSLPQLSDGSVSPSSGTSSTDFYYQVSYYDPDGDSPVVKQVCIDGFFYTMSLQSGLPANGVYRYGPKNPGIGSTHEYYFYFYDGKDGEATLPVTDSYPGPVVRPSFDEDNPDVTTGFASLGDKLLIAYGYKPSEGGWTYYNPSWSTEENTLTRLRVQSGYWVNVSEACSLEYGTRVYELDAGWNLIGWAGW